MKIGEVEIPIVSQINPENNAEVDEINSISGIENVVVKHEASPETITISAFLNEEVHSSSLTIEEQRKNVENLAKNETIDNSFNYKDYKGHLFIEDIDFEQNGDSKIIERFEITARYFPWPKYYPENEP